MDEVRHRPKIFCVGPNKAGTKALHDFFLRNGIRSISMGGPRASRNLAQSFLRNLSAARPILEGFEEAEAFSDISWIDRRLHIDVSAFVDALIREHPEAYYIYNTRPLEPWIASRLSHFGGKFLKDFVRCYGVSEQRAEEMWREYFAAHRAKVEAAVSGIGGRLLVFDIASDDPRRIAEFLAPHYTVTHLELAQVNVASRRMPLMMRLRRIRARFVR